MEDEKCPCGRILGRTDDMIIVRGVNVFPSQIEHVLMQIPEVEEHYVIYLDRDENCLDKMTIQVELSENAKIDRTTDILNRKEDRGDAEKRYHGSQQ